MTITIIKEFEFPNLSQSTMQILNTLRFKTDKFYKALEYSNLIIEVLRNAFRWF